jgi:hypothetical protein
MERSPRVFPSFRPSASIPRPLSPSDPISSTASAPNPTKYHPPPPPLPVSFSSSSYPPDSPPPDPGYLFLLDGVRGSLRQLQDERRVLRRELEDVLLQARMLHDLAT